jgi:uncharacterized protein YndB with AHSA1/START domain
MSTETTTTTSSPAVRLQRTISAPPAQVYRAWLEPELLRRWLAPGSLEVTRAEVEQRAGGRYRIWQAGPDGRAGGFEAELLELIPDERLVFRWGFVGPDRDAGPRYDSLLTITLAPASESEGSTELRLVHEQLEDLGAAMPQVAEKVGLGWELVLAKLAALLGA